jgi:tetratricopeptide (TPR) repeat protein
VPELHIAKALTEIALGDTFGSIESYRRAIAISPHSSADAYICLYELLKAKGLRNDAINALLSMISAISPYANGDYTAPTSGFRYKVSTAWELLSEFYIEQRDTAMAIMAADNAFIYGSPRELDVPMTQLGYGTPSPELVVSRFFDVISAKDTASARGLSFNKTGPTARLPEGTTMRVERILDVREDPVGERAEVDVVLRKTSADTADFANATIPLLLFEGRWCVALGASQENKK